MFQYCLSRQYGVWSLSQEFIKMWWSLLGLSTKIYLTLTLSFLLCFLWSWGSTTWDLHPKTLTFINLTIKKKLSILFDFCFLLLLGWLNFSWHIIAIFVFMVWGFISLNSIFYWYFGRLLPYVLCTCTYYMSTQYMCILYMCHTHVTYICTQVIMVTKLLSKIY